MKTGHGSVPEGDKFNSRGHRPRTRAAKLADPERVELQFLKFDLGADKHLATLSESAGHPEAW
jgi:hypothetical protein